jgi:hypothetical protein
MISSRCKMLFYTEPFCIVVVLDTVFTLNEFLDPSDWYFPQFLTVHCIRCKCMLKIWHSIIFAANYYIIRLFFRQFLECWFNIFKKHNAYDFHDYHWIIWGQIMNLTTSLLNNFMQELIQSEYWPYYVIIRSENDWMSYF